MFGILGHPEAATLTALGLHALQHRGQEAAGIVSFDGRQFHSERQLGLVGDHFTDPAMVKRLPGHMAMGHVRYSTTGETILRNVQPLFAELEVGGIAIAHNGNFTNGLTLRRELIAGGAICQSTSDTEVVLHLIARSRKKGSGERFIDALAPARGRLRDGRDDAHQADRRARSERHPPAGAGRSRRQADLCVGDLRARHHRRAIRARRRERRSRHRRNPARRPITIDSSMPFAPKPERLCLFEYVYFARPDSMVGGRSVYAARKRMGINLAQEAPVEADVVVPVPDGGTPAAIGYAQASGIPFELGIIRNHYVGRTFIEPTQSIRAFGVKLKHSANRAEIDGKRVVLIDDSIVRGTTSVKIVQMMREAGAREVHIRVASPMIFHSDYYGIDTPDHDNLLANQYDDARGDVPLHRRGLAGVPVDRRALRGGRRREAQQSRRRSSPTTISPATIRRR